MSCGLDEEGVVVTRKVREVATLRQLLQSPRAWTPQAKPTAVMVLVECLMWGGPCRCGVS